MFGLLPYRRPLTMLILVNVIGFTLLYFYRQPSDWHVLMDGLLVTALICTAYILIVKFRMGDQYLFLIVGMLASMGFIMLFRLDQSLGIKQTIWFVVGVVLFFASYFTYTYIRVWDRLMVYYIGAGLFLFGITLALGSNVNGSRNWISFGGVSFQPSEIIKLLLVFILACMYKGSKQLVFRDISFDATHTGVKGRLSMMAVVYGFMGLLVLQREWGTVLLLFFIYISLLYALDNDYRFIFGNVCLAVLGGYGGFTFVRHIKVRVDTWLNPWPDIAGKGYQITQSLFAIGSGGFFGTGIGLGRPDLIPEVKTDFIFSAICEEMGIFGGVAVILLYFIIAYRGFKIAMLCTDTFKRIVALGITLMFGFQTFIIIGGVIKLIPLTGITLPFISYGGSSLTASFIALGILQGISAKYVSEGGDAKE